LIRSQNPLRMTSSSCRSVLFDAFSAQGDEFARALLTAGLQGFVELQGIDKYVGDMISLVANMQENFMKEDVFLQVTPQPKMKIFGDVHGQFNDLFKLLDAAGPPGPNNQYLFLGDYVDRGKQSLETMCFLLYLKAFFPGEVYLLRGNHECASINRDYGFYDECKTRLPGGVKVWKRFTDMFNRLPVAALVGGKIFCVHGGLSPELTQLEQVAYIMRPTDVPETGLLCDLLWSDPSHVQTDNPDVRLEGWDYNKRGVSFTFGTDIVREFCSAHNIDLLVRAHQVVEDGYEFFADQRCITVFSAVNYCGEFDNKGAILSVESNASGELICSLDIIQPKHLTTTAMRASYADVEKRLRLTKRKQST